MTRRSSHLYRGRGGSVPEEFRVRYGNRSREVYGRTINKVARERAEEHAGEYREYVRGHYEERDGRRIRVRGHTAVVHAHPHSMRENHHGGACGPSCRHGKTVHRHSGRRRRS